MKRCLCKGQSPYHWETVCTSHSGLLFCIVFDWNIRHKCREQSFARPRSFFSKDSAHCPRFDLHSVSQCFARDLLYPSVSTWTVPCLSMCLLVVEGADKSVCECVEAVVLLRGIRTAVCRAWGRFELCLCALFNRTLFGSLFSREVHSRDQNIQRAGCWQTPQRESSVFGFQV